MFVVLSGRSRDNSSSPLTVPVRWVACKGGLCFNPSSRLARLVGAPSLHLNRPLNNYTASCTYGSSVSAKIQKLLKEVINGKMIQVFQNFSCVSPYALVTQETINQETLFRKHIQGGTMQFIKLLFFRHSSNPIHKTCVLHNRAITHSGPSPVVVPRCNILLATEIISHFSLTNIPV